MKQPEIYMDDGGGLRWIDTDLAPTEQYPVDYAQAPRNRQPDDSGPGDAGLGKSLNAPPTSGERSLLYLGLFAAFCLFYGVWGMIKGRNE